MYMVYQGQKTQVNPSRKLNQFDRLYSLHSYVALYNVEFQLSKVHGSNHTRIIHSIFSFSKDVKEISKMNMMSMQCHYVGSNTKLYNILVIVRFINKQINP